MVTKKKLFVGVVSAIVVVGLSIQSIASYAKEVKIANTDIQTLMKVQENVQSTETGVLTDADVSVDMLRQQLVTTPVVSLTTSQDVTEYMKENNLQLKQRTDDYSSVDNSQVKYFPPIDNQGTLGSCTAWATVYYQLSYAVNKELNRDGSKKDNMLSPNWIYNMINDGENQGTIYSDALKVLSEVGAVPITMVPLSRTDNGDNVRNIKAKKENWLEARKYRVDEYYSIDIGNDLFRTVVKSPSSSSLQAVKKALAGGEILSATTYSAKWEKKKIEEKKDVPENSKYVGEQIITRCDKEGYAAHRITIVGYDDNIWVDINEDGIVQEGEKGAFKIANSWGKYSDNKGFVWMSYDALNKVSCLKDSTNVSLKSKNRKPGLFDIIGFTIDIDYDKSDCFLALELETNNANSVSVNIKAKPSRKNSVYEYNPIPFINSNLTHCVGPYPINGSNDDNKGEFYIDLSNVVPGITKYDIDKYDWEITVTDTVLDKSVVKVDSASFYVLSKNKYTKTSLKQPITLDGTFTTITLGKKIKNKNTLETSADSYTFKTTERKEYIFSTPYKYVSKRYYDIYILDKEYTGDIEELPKKYSIDLTTKDGTESINIDEDKYVYCVAKGKSKWTSFIYKNFAKLTIEAR